MCISSGNGQNERRSLFDNNPNNATTTRISPASRIVNNAMSNSSFIDPIFTFDQLPGTGQAKTAKNYTPQCSYKTIHIILAACIILCSSLVRYQSSSEISASSNDVNKDLVHEIIGSVPLMDTSFDNGSEISTSSSVVSNSKIPAHDIVGSDPSANTVFDNDFTEEFNRVMKLDSVSVFKGHLRDGFFPFILRNGTLLCRRTHRTAIREATRIRAVVEMIYTGLELYHQENLTHKNDFPIPILLLNGDVNGCMINEQWDKFDFPRFTWSYPSLKHGTNWCKAIPVPSYETWRNFHKGHTTHLSWNATFESHMRKYPWSSKINRAVWRGATTYDHYFHGVDLNETPRGQLVQKSMENPDLIDAGFVELIQQYESGKGELSNQETILTDRMQFDDQMKYKAILDIDGNNWSSRFPKLLCTNSVVIKIDPDYVEHFYHELVPMVHYVPASLENVTQVAAYVLDEENAEEMRNIILSANMWCKRKMTAGEIARDMMLQLEHYQTAINPYLHSSAVHNDSASSPFLHDDAKDLDLVDCVEDNKLGKRDDVAVSEAPKSESASSDVGTATKFDHPLFPADITQYPYGEGDDLRVGRSCVYRHQSNRRSLSSYSSENPWLCRECSSDGSSTVSCKPLKRRGRCHPFLRMNPDQTPRLSSEYNPFGRDKSATAVYHHDGHSEYAKRGVPMCSATLSPPCFDLMRCRSSDDGPLKVYSYGGDVGPYLDYTARHGLIQRVGNASDACLLVVGVNSFADPQDLFRNEHWNGGQNHYIFGSGKLFGSHGDRPFNDKVQFGMAAVSSHSMDDAYNREGFDTPLPLPPRWKRPAETEDLDDMNRPRQYLLSFKGNIFPWEQRSWQHRWLAEEYWYGEKDVYVDTSCESSPRIRADYASTDPEDYGRLLLNSTFHFCPGGGGMNSFRFAEALSAGAIPVVTGDFLAPFHPEIDWSGCIVRVSEARVVDVPNIVRGISAEEVRKRRRRCARLSNAVFGKPHVFEKFFSVSMRVWNIRVRNAIKGQDEIELFIN